MNMLHVASFAALFLFSLIPQSASSDEVNLGFKINSGTYDISVQFPELGVRNLTLDTGASYTVLDRKDVQKIPGIIERKSNINLFLPFDGKAVPASFVVVPYMRIGDCVLRDRSVVVTDLPKDRSGALGMNDLEELTPFTFIGDGKFRFHCPS